MTLRGLRIVVFKPCQGMTEPAVVITSPEYLTRGLHLRQQILLSQLYLQNILQEDYI
jgi:hypothetical protein